MGSRVGASARCQTEVIQKLKESLKSKVCSLQSSGTASLWFQYLDMIDILRNFIRAQRIGNWELHLQSLSDMLPYLAASGHNHYTKCVWIYLQQMSKLEDEHPIVYRHLSSCNEKKQSIVCWSVHRPSDRASTYEDLKDDWGPH